MISFLTYSFCFCAATLFYHYIGYPIVLFILVKIVPRPPITGEDLPSVTLIIAAYNEASIISEKLENSLSLDYPNLEILVVSDGSVDETPLVVKSFASRDVKSFHEDARRGKAHAISRVVTHARGDVIVFSDANAIYAKDAIRRLVRYFADANVAGVSGSKTIADVDVNGNVSNVARSESLYWRYESTIKGLETRLWSTAGVVGEMFAVRRQNFLPIPEHIINDDSWMALSLLRIGKRVVYEPSAICTELPSGDFDENGERVARMSAGRYQLMCDRRNWPWSSPLMVFILFSHKFLRLLLPFFMIGALLFNALLFIASTVHLWFVVTGMLQMLFYMLAAAGKITAGNRGAWRIASAAYYITNGNFNYIRGLARHLTGRQSQLWTKVSR